MKTRNLTTREYWIFGILITIVLTNLLIGVIMPMILLIRESLFAVVLVEQADGSIVSETQWVGFDNFITFFKNKNLSTALFNSLKVSSIVTLIALIAGFICSYATEMTAMKGKSIIRILAMTPLFAPTMLFGIALVYLFGRKGLITTGFFGQFPGYDIDLYGFNGIVIAEAIYVFPTVFLILTISLKNLDARLYEAADSMGASPLKKFWTITLPGMRYGIVSAGVVAFILSFTDFGAPKVVGGQYNVLAVDIYKKVIGQQDFNMGSTVSVVLLLSVAVAFLLDRWASRKQTASATARSVRYVPKKLFKRDLSFTIISTFIITIVSAVILVGLGSAFIEQWPYKLNFSWKHFLATDVSGGAKEAIYTSLKMSAWTAILGTILVFLTAYIVEKTKPMPRLRKLSHGMSIMPLAIPGIVLGLAYIFFFNKPGFDIPYTDLYIPNPFESLYGTLWILVLCNIIHFYPVAYLTVTTALKQLDKEFEAVSHSMSVPFWKTALKVSVPLTLPALIEAATYFFVSSMVTVSALMFIYSSDAKPATVTIVNMDDAGDQAPAAALCVTLFAICLGTKILAHLVIHCVKKSRTKKVV